MNSRALFYLLIVFVCSFAAMRASETPPKPTELTVSIISYSDKNQSIVVRFKNHTQNTLVLLRPLDGSEAGWHMPIYDLTITTSAGNTLAPNLRCGESGLYADLKWPDDYRITIQPNASQDISISAYNDHVSTGRYSLRFRYTYDPTGKALRPNPGIVYPKDMWIGSASSRPFEIDVSTEINAAPSTR